MSTIKQSDLIKLNDVRLSFPSLFNVKIWPNIQVKPGLTEPNVKPKYEATFILDKETNNKEIELIKNTINSICAEKKVSVEKIKSCFLDGDSTDREEYKNKYVLKAKSSSRFPIVNKDGKTPVHESDNLFYGGCFVSAYINLYFYNKIMVGIGANLKSIQFRKDGPSFNDQNRIQNIEGAFDPIDDTDDLF